MNASERARRQQVIGVVNMVFDVIEGMDLVPDEDDFYAAITDWLRHGTTPSAESLGYWKEGTNCTICDAEGCSKHYPICSNCDDKGNAYEKEIQ